LISAGAPTWWGSLPALLVSTSWILRGPTSKGKEGEEATAKRRELLRGEKGEGKTKMEGKGTSPRN